MISFVVSDQAIDPAWVQFIGGFHFCVEKTDDWSKFNLA
jgi:hypothetical protein